MELECEIDNRDSNVTWLQVSKAGEPIGHIELTLEDMFDLIDGVMENNPEMDTSYIEGRIDALKTAVYEAKGVF